MVRGRGRVRVRVRARARARLRLRLRLRVGVTVKVRARARVWVAAHLLHGDREHVTWLGLELGIGFRLEVGVRVGVRLVGNMLPALPKKLGMMKTMSSRMA